MLLCFAVLWVLGIAYYFYSGTALSRKVGFPSSAVPFLATRFVSVSVWRFSSRTKRKMERCDFGAAVLPSGALFFATALML